MKLYESIETNALLDDLSKMVQDKYNISPKIVSGSSSSVKQAVAEGLPDYIVSGIECFAQSGLSIDTISIGFPGAGDNGVWNNEYDITFTDDATGETFDGNLLRLK